MKKYIYYIFMSIIIFGYFGCSNEDIEETPAPDTELDIHLTKKDSEVSTSINALSFELIASIERLYGYRMDNYVFSPYGVAWGVAMLANGADVNSQTERNLISVLKLVNDITLQDFNEYSEKIISALSNNQLIGNIKLANAFIHKEEINIQSKYLEIIKSYYKSDNFVDPTSELLGKWINENTEGYLKFFATDNQKVENMQMGGVSQMYINLVWSNPNFVDSGRESFYNLDGSVSNPNYIRSAMKLWTREDDTCSIIDIPFAENNFIISFVTPVEGKTLNDVSKHLNNETWICLHDKNSFDNPIELSTGLYLPKSYNYTNMNLVKILDNMGINWQDIDTSDFSKISNNAKMPVLYHVCVTNIDSFNVSSVNTRGNKDPGGYIEPIYKTLYFDHPFYYFITERSTGAILFVGRISKM